MNEYLTRNWPLVVVVIVLLIAMGMSSWIVQTNLPGKGLEFRLVDMLPFDSMDHIDGPKIGLTVDGKKVDNAYLSTLLIKNSGNIPLNQDDYEEPMHIHIENDAQVVQVRYVLLPEFINTDINFTSESVVITPALLNPGDAIILQVFTEGPEPDLEVDARVAGVHSYFSKNVFVDHFWGEIGWLTYLVFVFCLFNLLLLAMLLKTDANARYVVLSKAAGAVVFGSMTLVTLYVYFSLMVDHGLTFYASKWLLLAFTLAALLVAWQVLRFTEKE